MSSSDSFDINSPTRTSINLQAAQWFQKPDASQALFYKRGIYLSREIKVTVNLNLGDAEKAEGIKLMIDKLLQKGDEAAISNILSLNKKDKKVIVVTMYDLQTCGIKLQLELTREKAADIFQPAGRTRAYSEPVSPRMVPASPTKSPYSPTRSSDSPATPASPASPASPKMEREEKKQKFDAGSIDYSKYAVAKPSPRRGSMLSPEELAAAIKKMQTKKTVKA